MTKIIDSNIAVRLRKAARGIMKAIATDNRTVDLSVTVTSGDRTDPFVNAMVNEGIVAIRSVPEYRSSNCLSDLETNSNKVKEEKRAN